MKTRRPIWLILAIVIGVALAIGTTALAMSPEENPVQDAIRILFVSTAVDSAGNPVETPKEGALGVLQGSGTISVVAGDLPDLTGSSGVLSSAGALDLDGRPVETPKDGVLGELQGSGTAEPPTDGSVRTGVFE